MKNSHGAEDTVESDLVPLIPPDARVVVQVGCRSDTIAADYRRINPRACYLGLAAELESPSLPESRHSFDRLLCGELNTINPSDCGLDEAEPGVDCLVFDEVLETLVEPGRTLQRLSGWLSPHGQAIARIPNVQHYSVVVDLLRGKWAERENGPLDKRHRQFFTLDAVKELFSRAGLRIFDLRSQCWPGNEFDQFMQVIEPILGPLGVDRSTFAQAARATHFLVRASRTSDPPPRRTLIWSFLGSAIGSEVRVEEPCQFLSTIPGVRTVATQSLTFDHLDRTLPMEHKIFLEQRIVIPRPSCIQLQRALLARGYLIIAEFDDDPDHFPALVADGYFALECCHAIQTSTDVMAETLRAYHPRVAVFPNQIARLPRSRLQQAHDPTTPRPAVTIFFGALNREADWAPLIPALNQVLALHPGAVQVQVVYDRSFHDALTTPDKRFEPLCSYGRYHELLDSADIVISPLEPTRFNKHKSDLKFIEAAAHRAAVLASPTVYSDSIDHGQTGLIYHSIDQFKAQLDRLIQDANYRHQLGYRARQYVVENRMLSQHFRARYEWYESLLGQLDELNAELEARVPELFAN